MVLTTLVLASVLVSGPLPHVSEQFASLFEAREYRYSGGMQELCIRYRLFVPRDLQPTERCPLLLWLHGKGEGGLNNRESLMYLPEVLSDLKHLEKYRFFILVPQCQSADMVWSSSLGVRNPGTREANDMLTVTHQILERTMQKQPVDADRVYLMGVCSGGNGCWEMAIRYPEQFAAVVPTSPGGGDVSQAARLVNIPIWAFHNNEAGLEGTIEMVSAVEHAGGNIHLTRQQISEHNSWDLALKRYDVMTWMLEQRRGAWICWRPPGCKPWRWWHIFGVPFVFLSLVCLGWYSERRRRARRAGAQEIEAATRA